MGGEEELPGDGLLIERVEQVLRREGDRWEVITTDQVLQDFLIEGGDYTFVAQQPDTLRTVSGGNEVDWEVDGNTGVLRHQHANVPECRIREDVLMSVIKLLVAQRRKR